MSEWIKCSDKMPDTKVTVIGYFPSTGEVLGVIRCNEFSGVTGDIPFRRDEVSHWQPMPAPPTIRENP